MRKLIQEARCCLRKGRGASRKRHLTVVKTYFRFDARRCGKWIRGSYSPTSRRSYLDLLKDEQRADLELPKGNKAREDYQRFLEKRMDIWRENVKMGVRSKAELRQEAEETRKRVGLETRPDKNDPLLQRTTTFDSITTWVIDYFESLEHYDFILNKSRRDELRERAQKNKDDLIQLRRSALDDLDRYLKPPPK